MRSRGTKRRPGAEWASWRVDSVDSALTAWLQTVQAAESHKHLLAQLKEVSAKQLKGVQLEFLTFNYKCFRKAHTCKGHWSQRFFPLALFMEPIVAGKGNSYGAKVLRSGQAGATVAGSASKCQGIDVQGSITPQVQSYLMYIYVIYLYTHYFFYVHFQ